MFKLLSPNMLKTFELCHKKFYFKYVKNISMPTNDEIFELGKNIHAIASYYLRKENIDKMEQALNERELVLWQYLKGIEYFSYEVINTEYNLSVKVGNQYFGGRIDAIVKHNDKYYILDYKTGSAPKNAKYDYQTMVYLLTTKEFYKSKNICFVYIDLKNKTEVKIELDDALILEYEEKLKSVVQSINSSDFSSKNKECNCEYKIICY